MGFYIQDDMWEALAELPRKTQDEVAGALCRLFFDGAQSDLKGVSKSLFIAFRERVLLSATRSESGKQNGKQSRSKAASKTGSKTASKAEAKTDPSIKEGEGEREVLPDGSTGKRARARFSPPTTDEVAEHVREKGYCFDPAAFTAYYESVGWRINGNPMRSWQAACTTWERRERAEKGGGGSAGDVYSRL